MNLHTRGDSAFRKRLREVVKLVLLLSVGVMGSSRLEGAEQGCRPDPEALKLKLPTGALRPVATLYGELEAQCRGHSSRPVGIVWQLEDGSGRGLEEGGPGGSCTTRALRQRVNARTLEVERKEVTEGMGLCENDLLMTWSGVSVVVQYFREVGGEGRYAERGELRAFSRLKVGQRRSELVEGTLGYFADPDYKDTQVVLGSKVSAGGWGTYAELTVTNTCESEGTVTVPEQGGGSKGEVHQVVLCRRGLFGGQRCEGEPVLEGEVRRLGERGKGVGGQEREALSKAEERYEALKGEAKAEAVPLPVRDNDYEAPPAAGVLDIRVKPKEAGVWLNGEAQRLEGGRLRREVAPGPQTLVVRAWGQEKRVETMLEAKGRWSQEVEVQAPVSPKPAPTGAEPKQEKVQPPASPKPAPTGAEPKQEKMQSPPEAEPAPAAAVPKKVEMPPEPVPAAGTLTQTVLPGSDQPITWVYVPAGEFTMGTDDEAFDEKPTHQVKLSAFKLSKTEVTVAQYDACVQAKECTEPDTGSGCNWKVAGREKHPINCVDWEQAKAFTVWLSKVSGQDVRLPSEAQWEYAARGPKGRKYPWGNAPEPDCTLAVFDPSSSGDSSKWGCGDGHTAPVCSRSKGNTPEGICDLAGNVFEWTEDCYHENYNNAPDDGSAWTSACSDSALRVLRGGSWGDDPGWLRGASRGWWRAVNGNRNGGFRPVLLAPPGGDN